MSSPHHESEALKDGDCKYEDSQDPLMRELTQVNLLPELHQHKKASLQTKEVTWGVRDSSSLLDSVSFKLPIHFSGFQLFPVNASVFSKTWKILGFF